MNIANLPLFYDIVVQAVLSPPATGPTWNTWWSWSAWTCWREGRRFPLAITQHVPVYIQWNGGGLCVWDCTQVCVVCFYISKSFLSIRARMEKLETLGQLESLALV